jgi:integrase
LLAKEKIYNVTNKNQTQIDKYIAFRRALNKSSITLKNENATLQHLGDFIGEKTFDQINEEELQQFFTNIDNLGTRDIKGLRITQFYRWLNKLDKHEKPQVMKWFEFSSSDQRERNKDPDVKKYLFTPEEYRTIITASGDAHGMWQALWETYYLSGARLGEVHGMRIKDVKIVDGNVSILVIDSKTIPREIPLTEKPNLLLRWFNNHPHKNLPDSPLWISHTARTYLKKLTYSAIGVKFDIIRKYTNIKKTLSVHCFRKTRATAIFSSRDPIYDDAEIGKFFGWKSHTVIDRRQQYDLRNIEDLKDKVFGTITGKLETYDIIKQEKELLEQKHEVEINRLKKQVIDLTLVYEHDLQQNTTDIEKYQEMTNKKIEKLTKIITG